MIVEFDSGYAFDFGDLRELGCSFNDDCAMAFAGFLANSKK